jgi:pimeloyl-ACP methyl ester carboxylesterase
MPRVEIDGTSLECLERGRGEPVVLVHGSASDHRTWRRQLEVLGSEFRTIAYSRRYHWPNQPIAAGADYSMPEHVDDLAAVVRTLGAAPAHLVGHSYGAFVCLLLAVRQPDLVRSLVLTEPPAVTLFVHVPPRPLELLALLLGRPRTALAVLRFGATGIGPATRAVRRGDLEGGMRIFGRAVLGPEAYARLSEARREQIRANSIAAEFLGSGFAPLAADEVRAVRAPTLLVTGERSPRLFHCVIDRLAELLPRARRVEIPGASHIVHEDALEAWDAAALSHLRQHGRARAPHAPEASSARSSSSST